MSNSIPTWLAVIQAVFIFTTALEPGTYIYEAVDCTITYRVEADFKAVFTLKTHVKPGPRAAVDFLTTFTLPPVPLVSDDGNKTYFYSLRRAVPPRTIHDLFTGVKLAFQGAFWITPADDSFPPAGTKDGDFTVITYETPYAISINFRGKPIILVRNGRNAVAGKYVYRSSTHPRFKLAYRIRRDGSVRIRAKCEKRGTPRFHFRLSERFGPHQTSKYYAAESRRLPGSSSDDGWNKVFDAVRRACPSKSRLVESDDLKQVVAANETTIFVKFQRSRLPLARVSPASLRFYDWVEKQRAKYHALFADLLTVLSHVLTGRRNA
ncbi:hypothetical protein FOZ60_003250 [Perkinsus olseni]|uniref:Uncharacterized protein n=1 Tax=Perkinsus olseni TaxID=32597 RepID=A0A7J6NWV5_PEROL|nr:hypothetical protein FOZ60_003250 [Perkinsus olseni]